jgi:hypothetical protein
MAQAPLIGKAIISDPFERGGRIRDLPVGSTVSKQLEEWILCSSCIATRLNCGLLRNSKPSLEAAR